jgi:hypothetical protein
MGAFNEESKHTNRENPGYFLMPGIFYKNATLHSPSCNTVSHILWLLRVRPKNRVEISGATDIARQSECRDSGSGVTRAKLFHQAAKEDGQ